MTDDWGRDRAEPVAVGPPRRRMSRTERIREARGRRRRRFASGLALALLIVVVIGAVFLGSKLWHSLFGGGGDYSGDGVNDVVIQIHDGDSTTTIGKTLEDHKVVATVKAFVGSRRGQCRHLGDPARLLQGAYRDPGGQCRCATCRSAEPGRQAGDPRRPAARRHPGRQDQRGHRRHLQPDLARDLCGPRRLTGTACRWTTCARRRVRLRRRRCRCPTGRSTR